LEKLTAELLKPAEQKLVNSGKALASSEKVHKEAELRQKDADAKAKRLDAKKKVADAIAKKMTDASKKPKDVTVTLFTNPFTLKVRETPLELQPLGKQTIQVGEKVKLDLSIVRLFGFADAVSFKIVPPKEAKGVSAKVATIAKDAYATTLELVTSAATTAGEFECKLEGTLKFNNQNLKFTETFVLKVEPAPEVKKPG
jgi:ATP phosphoribosyltransferase regulatory subunit HisZ